MDKINKTVKYEYQILRYRHNAVSGEFVNIGIVFLDAENRFLRARVTEKYRRISLFFGHVSGKFLLTAIKQMEKAFNKIGNDWATDSNFKRPNSLNDITVSVLPLNDNGLFFSDVLKGWHLDSQQAFNDTYDRLIGQYSDETSEQRHDDAFAWKKIYKQFFDAQDVTKQLTEHNVKTESDVIEFDHAAKNGIWHCFQPISFDLKKTGDIKEKIYRWSGIVNELKSADEPLNLYLLSLMPNDAALRKMIEQKLNVEQPNLKVRIIEEQDAAALVQEVKWVFEHK